MKARTSGGDPGTQKIGSLRIEGAVPKKIHLALHSEIVLRSKTQIPKYSSPSSSCNDRGAWAGRQSRPRQRRPPTWSGTGFFLGLGGTQPTSQGRGWHLEIKHQGNLNTGRKYISEYFRLRWCLKKNKGQHLPSPGWCPTLRISLVWKMGGRMAGDRTLNSSRELAAGVRGSICNFTRLRKKTWNPHIMWHFNDGRAEQLCHPLFE